MEATCRVCTLTGSSSDYQPIDSYLKTIEQIYGIDISDEGDECPKVVCNGCRMKLYRYRSTRLRHQGKKRKVNLPEELPSFPQKQTRKRLKFSEQESDSEVGAESLEALSDEHTEKLVPSETEPQPGTSGVHLQSSPGYLPSAPLEEESDDEETPANVAPSPGDPPLDTSDAPEEMDDSFHQKGPFVESASISFAVDLFKDTFVADILKCNCCSRVPSNAAITPCHHVFCRTCINGFLQLGDSCPKCASSVLPDELSQLTGHILGIYNNLQLKCHACDYESTIVHMMSHMDSCKGPPVYRMSKVPLSQVKVETIRYKRLPQLIKTVKESVSKVATTQFEDETDLYFALLAEHLNAKKDHRYQKVVEGWKHEEEAVGPLSADVCLALRVDSIQSKNQYAKQFAFLKKHEQNPFCSLSEINEAEKRYMPGYVRYGIEGFEPQFSRYHTPAKITEPKSLEPIDIMEDFSSKHPELFIPNVCGVRWSYQDCLAKTLEELSPAIDSNLKKLGLSHKIDYLYKVYVKDGCDGMGDVSVYRQRSDRGLPDKAFRTSFCVMKIVLRLNDQEHIVFQEENPNSVRTNRPLLEAICDENDPPSAMVCILPVEHEREFLTGKIMKVECPGSAKRFELDFYSSMIDEKLDRAESGLQGSGSSYICTLCHATRQSAVSDVGTFAIDRTYKDTLEMAEYLRLNPDKLSDKKLEEVAKGVKSVPILLMDGIKKGLDATHADINLGRFFKNLISREIAQVYTWQLTAVLKDHVIHAEKKFDDHLRRTVGLNTQLMMPGNYARVLFEEQNSDHVVALIPVEEKRAAVKRLLVSFREMRTVYRANKPLESCPEKVSAYRQTALAFASGLKENFSYAHWPNYLHKVIEHVQELIERPDGPGTVGGMSGEGNEGGNKVFRHFRKNLSRRGATYDSVRDVLVLHWLYSSPPLIALAAVEKTKRHCSLCKEIGHYIRTCPKRITS